MHLRRNHRKNKCKPTSGMTKVMPLIFCGKKVLSLQMKTGVYESHTRRFCSSSQMAERLNPFKLRACDILCCIDTG